MRYHVVVEPKVSPKVGAAGLTRSGVIRVLANLHFDLHTRADEFRGDRWPADPDLFRYPFVLLDGQFGHLFEFFVDDGRAPGYVFVEDVRHHTFPRP